MIFHGSGFFLAVPQHRSIRGNNGNPQFGAGLLQPPTQGLGGSLIIGPILQIDVGQGHDVGQGILRLIGVNLLHQRHRKKEGNQQPGGDGQHRRPEEAFSHE